MKTIDFSYFIERYNAGEMSDAENQWFQKELKGNEKLRNEVKLRNLTEEILKSPDTISLRNKLAEIEKRRAANVPVSTTRKPVYHKYAAVIAGLVLIGSITVFSGKKLSSEEIINQYYKEYQPPTVQRSGQAEIKDNFTLAVEYYNAHDFGNAAMLFSKVVENDPKDMQSTLLNGIANFENNKLPEAQQSFGIVISDNDNMYIDQAEWFLALCYLKTGKKEKAIQQLEIVKKESGYYSYDAKKFLKKLK